VKGSLRKCDGKKYRKLFPRKSIEEVKAEVTLKYGKNPKARRT